MNKADSHQLTALPVHRETLNDEEEDGLNCVTCNKSRLTNHAYVVFP